MFKLKFSGYSQPYRKDRSDNSGYGGVLAWVREQIFCKIRIDLEINDIEAMW